MFRNDDLMTGLVDSIAKGELTTIVFVCLNGCIDTIETPSGTASSLATASILIKDLVSSGSAVMASLTAMVVHRQAMSRGWPTHGHVASIVTVGDAPRDESHARSWCRMGCRADLSIFATTLDTFVAVAVKLGEILPEILVSWRDVVAILNGCEAGGEVSEGVSVEFVHMTLMWTLEFVLVTDTKQYYARRCTYLQVSKLGELFPAAFKLANVRFGLLMHDLVSTDVAALGKGLATDLARVRTFSSMAPFMSLKWYVSLVTQLSCRIIYLEVSKLREALSAVRSLACLILRLANLFWDVLFYYKMRTYIWLLSCMCSDMNL
jgi:hypothetical protein